MLGVMVTRTVAIGRKKSHTPLSLSRFRALANHPFASQLLPIPQGDIANLPAPSTIFQAVTLTGLRL